MVQRHLVHVDLWKIMSGAIPRPSALESDHLMPTPAQAAWDRSSLLAHVFVDRHITLEVQRYHQHHKTPQALWKALMEHYHQHDARALLKSFNDISSLRYSDPSTESFSDYLISFDHHWNDLCFRTDDADPPKEGVADSLETALKVLANSDESKREFVLASIPPSMMLFVINLKYRVGGELNYARLRSELRGYDALLKQYEEEQLEEREELEELDCTWCRSRGLESVGHEWKKCARLRQFKRQNR